MEKILRQIGREILQFSLSNLETGRADQTPPRIRWQNATYWRNRKTRIQIDTRFGPITITRWFYQNTLAGECH